MLEIIKNDCQYAMRLLAKKPGFSLLTILVMAAGIGLSVYLFSFLHTMLFKPLPFKDGDSLVIVSASENGQRLFNDIDLHDFKVIRDSVKGLTEIGSYRNKNVNVQGKDGARRYKSIETESNMFSVTRTKPILGKEFGEHDQIKGAKKVVIIGFDFWQNQFSGNENVLDQTVRINGEQYGIIGVMPEGYYFPNTADLWLPLRKNPDAFNRGDGGRVYGYGHLNGDYSMAEVNQQIADVMQRLELRFPETNNGISAYIDFLPMSAVEDGIPVVYSMQIVAVLLLLLASINVGNLLLSRAVERGKETAIRVALGAPRSRLISQMLWESIILCSIGGIIGLLLIGWGLDVTESITAKFNYGKQVFWFKFGIDFYTLKLFFSFLFLTIIITGVLPAWRSSGADFNSVLRDGTRGALGKKSGRLNRLLVISEIFISITVLITASVLIVSAYIRTHIDFGKDPDSLLTAQIVLPEKDYTTDADISEFILAAQSKLENQNGIGDVMITTALPGEYIGRSLIAVEGKEYTEERGFPRVSTIYSTSDTMGKLSIELKQGRYFNSGDDDLAKKSVIVSEHFVTQQFPNGDALGKRLRMAEQEGSDNEWLTIVGVVENIVQGDNDKVPVIYRTLSQAPQRFFTIAMRLTIDRNLAEDALRSTLSSIDPNIPADMVELYSDKIFRFSAPIRFISNVFLMFGVAAVFLAASGIYGVMANTINQKTHEIGVKRALGAREQRLIRELLWTGFKQLLVGGLPGLAAGCAMGYAMLGLMGVSAGALVFIATSISIVIGTVVMLATYLPSKRAMSMEPSEALHYE